MRQDIKPLCPIHHNVMVRRLSGRFTCSEDECGFIFTETQGYQLEGRNCAELQIICPNKHVMFIDHYFQSGYFWICCEEGCEETKELRIPEKFRNPLQKSS